MIMRRHELVSILIPAFNSREWIAKTIESALAQTWPHSEIVVVDDGSTDETLAIAQRYASERVLVLSQSNQGAAVARNTALTACQGDYIQWLDADDLLAPDKIEKQVNAASEIDNRRVLLSAAWAHFNYRITSAKFVATPLWADHGPLDWLLLQLGHNLHMQTATWLVTRELTTAAGPWDADLTTGDDGEYFSRVILASDMIKFVPTSKVFYRMVGTGRLSHVIGAPHKAHAQLLALERYFQHLRRREDSPRVRAACVKYLEACTADFDDSAETIGRLMDLARSCGLELGIPPVPAKYVVIDWLLGRRSARRIQWGYNSVKSALARSWDLAIYRLESSYHADD